MTLRGIQARELSSQDWGGGAAGTGTDPLTPTDGVTKTISPVALTFPHG